MFHFSRLTHQVLSRKMAGSLGSVGEEVAMSWLQKLLGKKLKCSVCQCDVYRASEIKLDPEDPYVKAYGDLEFVTFIRPDSAHQCKGCKRIFCTMHCQDERINAGIGVPTCPVCGGGVGVVP